MAFSWSTEELGTAILCLIVGTLLFLGLGALLFTVRELLPSQSEK